MVSVKHFMDAIAPEDGQRVWVEPFGLAPDLRRWCQVNQVLPQFGPPQELAIWYEQRDARGAYEFFRGSYHQYLSRGTHLDALRQLAWQGAIGNITLLHQGVDPSCNTATAVNEFLCDLSPYCPPYM